MSDLTRDLGPVSEDDDDPSPARIFTECALVALRYRDAQKTTADGRHTAQEIANAITIVAARWGVRL